VSEYQPNHQLLRRISSDWLQGVALDATGDPERTRPRGPRPAGPEPKGRCGRQGRPRPPSQHPTVVPSQAHNPSNKEAKRKKENSFLFWDGRTRFRRMRMWGQAGRRTSSFRLGSALEAASALVPSGLCAVYKPPGFTSFDVVAKIRGVLVRHIREKEPHLARGPRGKVPLKVGHGGAFPSSDSP